ncbi:MAG TPA: hypothetical protein VHP83_27140 [Aggregatilineaceae bacterium]|nr:hypothetical protein [Aggregatilineaceae bacterium]
MSELVSLAWKRWKTIGEMTGDFYGRLFAVIFYFTIFVPFALAVRLFSDPLQLRKHPAKWLDRAPVGTHPDDARRQF